MKRILLSLAIVFYGSGLFSAIREVPSQYSTIKAAVDAAADGDVINIAAGTYNVNATAFTNSGKSLTFNGAGKGFTIINCTTTSTGTNNRPGFIITSTSADRIVCIQNLTIQNCFSNTTGGGGIRATTSALPATLTLNVTNVELLNNFTAGNQNIYGGGIFLSGIIDATITNCKFTGNRTYSLAGGAAIYVAPSAVSLIIDGCNITGNSAGAKGGGAILAGVAGAAATGTLNIKIKNSTLSSNTATGTNANGGAINILCGANGATDMSHSLWIENSTIYGNSTLTNYKNGGAIHFQSAASGQTTAPTQTITLNHTTIANNTTTIGGGPDGICISSSSGYPVSVVMNNSIVMNNSGSTLYQSQIGVDNTSVTNMISNGGITNSIFNIIADGTWVTTENNNNLTATVNDLAFATSLSTDATPALITGSKSIARNYVSTNYLVPALSTDQLGNPRMQNTDAGAWENQAYAVSSGVTNASDIACTTCDVDVAPGAELTVGVNKELKSVTVLAGGKLTINGGDLTTTDGITLESDANGTATLVDNYTDATVNATVKQYVESGRNWYVSSPVSTAGYGVLNRGTKVVEWDEINKEWDDVTSGNLLPGKGYIQVATSTPEVTGTTGTVNFSGFTNSGTVTAPTLTRTAGTSAGFNLVGNPYPSYLDWGEVATANPKVLPTAYYRTKKTTQAGGGYTFASVNMAEFPYPKIVSNDASTTITKFIPPMQAFWVRVDPLYSEVTDFTFSNANREHLDAATPGNIFKAPKATTEPSIRLKLLAGNVGDEALVYVNNNASNDFDRYDSPKMFANSANTPELYTKVGSEKLVINGLNEIIENRELTLGFNYSQPGELKLKATEINNFQENIRIYLRDKIDNKELELFTDAEYTFNTTTVSAYNESRFSLIFRASGTTTGVYDASKLNAQVFVNAANQITIIAPENAKYAIYNALGQKINEGITALNKTIIIGRYAAGIYVVRVYQNEKSYSTRVLLNANNN